MGPIEFAVQLLGSIALTAWVLERDIRRLPPEMLARTWNRASFWSAVVAFGYFSIPVHFCKSRRSLTGLGLGVLWMTLVVLAIALLAWITGVVFEAARGQELVRVRACQIARADVHPSDTR